MGLSNASSRARLYNSTINQNQGGGSKKAGLPQSVGRDSWTSIYIGNNKPGKCCSRSSLLFTKYPNVRPSRPIGADVRFGYFSRG
jgi:hypothetical protein